VSKAGFTPSAASGEARAEKFLADLAGRVGTGIATVSVVLDPGMVVLGGDVGLAGGADLARRVATEVGRITPARPDVAPTAVDSGPVLRGAILAAVDQARAELLDSVAAP
jgi:predicted NBD/HSP70 family sugar kinase